MTSYNGTDDIMTASGLFFDFMDPKPEQIEIRDIAHALSMTCRFSGHCLSFYSVAEHSVRVSYACNPEDALWGLLHDASEAYLTDIPRPIKRRLPEYKTMEKRVQSVICGRFGLHADMPESVHEADGALLATEGRDLCAKGWEFWGLPHSPLPEIINPWPQMFAKKRFLERFEQLFKAQSCAG